MESKGVKYVVKFVFFLGEGGGMEASLRTFIYVGLRGLDGRGGQSYFQK
jgi:hypothetical protein